MCDHPSQNSKSMNLSATIPSANQDRRVRIGPSDPNIRWLRPALLPESRMYSNLHQPACHLREKGEKKKEGKERKRKQGLPRKATMGIGHTITPPIHHSQTSPTPSRRPFGTERRERKKKKKEEQRLDHDSLDMTRLSSTTLFYPLPPSPPSYIPYPIPTPRDQTWSETEALAYSTANQT